MPRERTAVLSDLEIAVEEMRRYVFYAAHGRARWDDGELAKGKADRFCKLVDELNEVGT